MQIRLTRPLPAALRRDLVLYDGAASWRLADARDDDPGDGSGGYSWTAQSPGGIPQWAAGDAACLALALQDTVPPAPAGAEIGSIIGRALEPDPNITLFFDEGFDLSSFTGDRNQYPHPEAFTVTVDGEARTVQQIFVVAELAADGHSAISISLPEEERPRHGETVTLSYAPPAGPDASPLADAAGNEMAGFADLAVANRLPPGPPEAPEGLEVAAGGTKAALSWSAPFDGGGAITKYQARWKKGATADGDWEDVPESGPETASHAVSGLDSGAQYTFQVRAVSRVRRR